MKITLHRIALGAWLVMFALPSVCHAGITIEHAFCRGGQVFLHWSDSASTYTSYRVYRSAQPIDNAEALDEAALVVPNARRGSAKDQVATYIASKQNQPDPNIGLRLFDLGPTLDPADELEVMTVRTAGQNYYAVTGIKPDQSEDRTIVPGANSLTSPIDEAPGDPCPVLEEEGALNVGGYVYPWKTYTWYRRADEALHDGEPTKITVTLPTNQPGPYRTMIYLHAYGGTNIKQAWWNMIVISPCDYTPGLPYSGHTWWSGYCDSYPDVTTGTVVNYSENMLVRMIKWAEATLPVDPNRVFVNGGSMGGTGAISFGMRHPELIAGIYAQVPQVNPGLPGIGWPQTQLAAIWGTVSTNLPSSDGPGIWDRMNMTRYAADHTEDMPFLKVQNSKNDTTLLWFQIPDFYRNLNASRHGFICAWGQGGHGSSSTGLPPAFLNFDIYSKIYRNLSYVAVSNSSANNNPGNGDPLDGDSVGQMNAGYDWTILADTADQWKALIKYTAGGTACADISARRLQSFDFAAGDRLGYCLTDPTTGAVMRTGTVTAERDRFFVIPDLLFDAVGRNLTVWKTSSQRADEVLNLDEGAAVDLDEMVVTAVFDEVAYAQPLDMLPPIAIVGASGISEGSLIRLRGTKTTLGKMCAVRASPALPTVYGIVRPKPLGMSFPFCGLPDRPLALGALVKVWGEVSESGPGWLNLRTAPDFLPVCGNIGSPPPVGFVVATGIVTEGPGPNGEPWYVRVRKSSDITCP